jgi:hypothetical protein
MIWWREMGMMLSGRGDKGKIWEWCVEGQLGKLEGQLGRLERQMERFRVFVHQNGTEGAANVRVI